MRTSSNLLLGIFVALALAVQPALTHPTAQPAYWQEIHTFLRQDKTHGIERCRTLFVGSSSIRFWDGLERDMPGRKVIRRGFGGALLSHVIFYFEQLIKRHQPSAIVLYAGENDISIGKPPSRVLSELKTFLEIKHRSLGRVPVYFVSIKPSPRRWRDFAAQSQANALVKDLARRRVDLVYVDVATRMLTDGRPKRIFLGDDLHMNLDGYALWAQAINNALGAPAPSPASSCR